MPLLVIEGTDGSGKGTQTKLLVKRLQEEGYLVRMDDFPRYDEPSSYFVQQYLNGAYGSAAASSPYKASLFYAMDRFAASFAMKEFLAKGGCIICNRYVSANKGHQLGKLKDKQEREAFLAWLNTLEYEILGVPKEDMTFLLFVPPELNQSLVDKKNARSYTDLKRDIHEADKQHLLDAADAFKWVAQKESWSVIDCLSAGKMRSIEDIHEELYAKIHPLLKKNKSLNR